MAFLVSPGVQVKEVDLTNVVPAVATSIGAIAGPFEKGPVSSVTTISSEEELVEIFGKPTYTDADPYEKVNAEWIIESKVVTKGDDDDDYFYKPFTIYNWKTGYIPTEEYEWHVGGHDYEAHEIASAIFENHINKSKG